MTHEETIKRIQSLVPSVMELEEGCWIKRNGTRENPQNILYKVLENRGLMTGISMHDPSYNKLICYDYTFETLKTFRSENEKENPIENSTILGKPITLAVIMLAIATEYNPKNTSTFLNIDSNGEFCWTTTTDLRGGTMKVIEPIISWNLSKDNFNDQTDETKVFIGELLNKEN